MHHEAKETPLETVESAIYMTYNSCRP